MSRHLGDEIAVLDGLDGMTPTGPGTGRSSPSRYVAPFSTVRRNVIDPSEGGNYGGGSNYAPRMPLLPSTVGLADFAGCTVRPYVVVQSIAGEGPTIVRRASDLAGALVFFNTLVNNVKCVQATPGQHSDVYEDSFVYIAKGGKVLKVWPEQVGVARVQQWTSSSGRFPLSGLSGGPLPTGRADSYVDFAALDGDAMGMTPTAPGTGRSSPSRYVAPFATVRRNVIDPSEGGNYGGGSAWAPGMPVMPSAVGLAGDFADADLVDYMNITSVLPPKRNVIDPSGGALFTGGSSWTGGIPLTPSNAGLAGGPIPSGRYDRYSDFAGLPTGRADKYTDFASLDAYFEAAGSSVTPTGPGTGRSSPSRYVAPFATVRRNVIDPSEGATYGGGSNFTPGMPLLPSTIGLAELSVSDMLDKVSDNAFTRKLFANQRPAFQRVAGTAKVAQLKQNGVTAARRAAAAMSWPQRAAALRKAQAASLALSRARMMRRALLGNRAAPMRPIRTIAAA